MRALFSGLEFSAAGGLVWVQGSSGAGKSELLRSVAGLVECAGTLELHTGRGRETPEAVGWPAWRAHVAYVPQAAPRFDQTAEAIWSDIEVLGVRRGRTSADPRRFTARWGLDDSAWRASMLDLSGGELQRLWLAVVLAGEPDVVLLDEPTAALDPDAARAVEADLVGRTGLLVTHDPAFGARASVGSLALVPPGEAG